MPDAGPDVIAEEVYDERLLHVVWLGLTSYDAAWEFQRAAARLRMQGILAQDVLILCEHPPVVTLGRGTKEGHLLASPEYLASLRVELRTVERGGDVTVHEPGQLVGYPIVNLARHKRDLHWYLRQLEDVIIRAVGLSGLTAQRREGLTGVWVEQRKLASIGVHARDWVTWHGFALNVSNTLATFGHVVPCGIDGVEMTTVARECVRAHLDIPSLATVRERVAQTMAQAFELSAINAPASVLDAIVSECHDYDSQQVELTA